MADEIQAFWQSLNPIEGNDSKYLTRAVVTDNVHKVLVEIITGSLSEVVSVCNRALNGINSAEELKNAFDAGQPINLHQFDPPTPTPEELALKAFLTAYAQYQSGYRKIQNGFLEANDPDVAALLVEAKKKYVSAYVGIG